MDARLENRRNDNSAKCANCREWEGRDTGKSAAMCEHHKMVTTDLTTCTGWEPHEILQGQIIKPGDLE